jgi:hypothetical protein
LELIGMSGERGEGTLLLSAFIFNVLGPAVWDGAPNFPPHGLVTIGIKCNQLKEKEKIAGIYDKPG